MYWRLSLALHGAGFSVDLGSRLQGTSNIYYHVPINYWKPWICTIFLWSVFCCTHLGMELKINNRHTQVVNWKIEIFWNQWQHYCGDSQGHLKWLKSSHKMAKKGVQILFFFLEKSRTSYNIKLCLFSSF